jgi:hypothetical protein
MRLISLAVAAAFTVLSVAAFAQTDAPKGDTGTYAPAGTPPTQYPLPKVDNGSPGLDVAGPVCGRAPLRCSPARCAPRERLNKRGETRSVQRGGSRDRRLNYLRWN